MRKLVFGIAAGVILLLITFSVMSSLEVKKDPTTRKINLMPKKQVPQKNLDYDFITVDTIAIPTFPKAGQPEPQPVEKLPVAEKPKPQQPSTKKTTPAKPKTTFRTSPSPQRRTATTYPRAASRNNSNMIITNNLQQNNVRQGVSRGSALGRDAALVKVVLPRATHASNSALIQARVLNDSRWGNIKIPRRSKIIGIASLFNGRVNIDFQQIIINDSTRSCNGQAYDLKRQRGLSYSQVSSDAEEIALQELQSATAGIPIVSSVASRVNRSNNINQETTTLDEGLEFYAWINSIF